MELREPLRLWMTIDLELLINKNSPRPSKTTEFKLINKRFSQSSNYLTEMVTGKSVMTNS